MTIAKATAPTIQRIALLPPGLLGTDHTIVPTAGRSDRLPSPAGVSPITIWDFRDPCDARCRSKCIDTKEETSQGGRPVRGLDNHPDSDTLTMTRLQAALRAVSRAFAYLFAWTSRL